MNFVRSHVQPHFQPLKKLLCFVTFTLVLFSLDWWTKVWVFNHPNQHFALIPGFVRVSYELNEQAAFGLPLPFPLIATLSILVVVGIGVWCGVMPLQFISLTLLLISAGATGNLLTRFWVSHRAEIDFLEFTWSDTWSRTCNIADLYIFLALFMCGSYGLKLILVKLTSHS